jgi:hypothetical protein
MKIITTVIIILLSSVSLYAQQPARADSTVAPPPPVAPEKTSSLSKYGLSVELTANGLSPLPSGVNNNIIGGLGFAINVERKIFLIKKNFFFSFGLGIATYDYATNGTINYASLSASSPTLSNYSYFVPIPDSVNYSKNKLNLVWLQVPVEFTLKTNPNSRGQSFNFTFGARFGYLINDHTKQKGTDSSGTYKVKIYEIKNMDLFSTMLTAKIGYGHFDLFGYYNLLTLFKSGDGETTNELGAGIALTF